MRAHPRILRVSLFHFFTLSVLLLSTPAKDKPLRSMLTTPIQYASNETRSLERERAWTTHDLVRRWQWHNAIRTGILIFGTLVGAVAVVLDR